MISLKNKHIKETCWIIGKGPSLLKLKREHIGDGPIIALYEAIVPIEIKGFPNVTYSLQKDGGLRKNHTGVVSCECDFRKCDECHGIVRPRGSILLLHEDEAKYCFEDYAPRFTFKLSEIGMRHNEFSLVCAIKIGQFMGCQKFKFVSCDAHANGDTGNVVPVMSQEYYDYIYEVQRQLLPEYLGGLDYEWITPE